MADPVLATGLHPLSTVRILSRRETRTLLICILVHLHRPGPSHRNHVHVAANGAELRDSVCCAWMHTEPSKLNAWLRAEQSASSTNHTLNQTFFPRFLVDFFHKPLFKTIMTILWNTQNDWITSPYASHSHTNGSSTHSFPQCTMGRRKKVDSGGRGPTSG